MDQAGQQPEPSNVNLLYSRPLEEYITTLRKGSWLLKHGRYGKPKLHYFRLVTHDTQLSWRSANGTRRTVDLRKVREVRRGQTTEVFKRNPQTSVANISFSLLYPGEENEPRSLDLICPGDDNFDMWFHGIKAVVEQIRTVSSLVVGKPVARVPPVPSARSELKIKPAANVEQPTPGRVSGDIGVPVASRNPGDLYIWGSAEANIPAGHKNDSSSSGYANRSSIPRLVVETKKLDVVKVAVGIRHCALITYGGELYSWGEGKGGQLGHGNQEDIGAPARVNTLWGTKVQSVQCSSGYTAALSVDNELFTWGDATSGSLGYEAIRQYIPRQVLGFGVGISEVSLGPYHAAAVGVNGSLFTWGDGMAGKLGHGSFENTTKPRKVAALDGYRVIHVACGYWHTAAIVQERARLPDGVDFGHITLDNPAASVTGKLRNPRSGGVLTDQEAGMLYTWGGELSWQECRTDAKGNIECKRDNHKGCLGLATLDGFTTPQRVKGALEGKGVIQVVAGLTFTAVVTQDLKVYQMGELSPTKDCPWSSCRAPELVRGGIENYRVEDLTCGMQHVAALARPLEKRSLGGEGAEGRVLLTWGRGQEGQLGLGGRNSKPSPSKVDVLSGKKVLQVACGEYYTMAVCEHNTRSEDSEEREQLQEAKDFFKYRIKGADGAATTTSFAAAAAPSFSRTFTSAALALDSDSADLESHSSSSDILSRNSSHAKLTASATNPFGMLKAINEWKRSKSVRTKSSHYSSAKSVTNGVRIIRKPSFQGLPRLPPPPDMSKYTTSGRSDNNAWTEQHRENNSASEYSTDIISNVDERMAALDKDHEDETLRKSESLPMAPDRDYVQDRECIRELEARLAKAELLLTRRTTQNDIMQRRNDEMQRELSVIQMSGGTRSIPHSPENSIGSITGLGMYEDSLTHDPSYGASPSLSLSYAASKDAREERLRDREQSLHQQEHLLLRRCREVEAKEAELSRKEDEIMRRWKQVEEKETVVATQWLALQRERDGKPPAREEPSDALSAAVLGLLTRSTPVPTSVATAETNGSSQPVRKASEVWMNRYDSMTAAQSPSQQQLSVIPQRSITLPRSTSNTTATPFLTPNSSFVRHASPDRAGPSGYARHEADVGTVDEEVEQEQTASKQQGERWSEEVDKGVFMCFEMRDNTPQLVRIRFSRRKFSKEGAEQWYINNRMKIAERYSKLAGAGFNVPDSELKLASSLGIKTPGEHSGATSMPTPETAGDWLDYADNQRPRSRSSPPSLDATPAPAPIATVFAGDVTPPVDTEQNHNSPFSSPTAEQFESPRRAFSASSEFSDRQDSGVGLTMLAPLPSDSPDMPQGFRSSNRRNVTWADR